MLSGQIPDISRSFPLINELNLSNQSRAENGGLSGPIPLGWSNLRYLVFLDLSYNKLDNVVPPDMSNLPQLKVLNISNNDLSGELPTELGNLAGILEIFDVSNNVLTGTVPFELGSYNDALILLSGNNDLWTPAPLSLCFVPGFDLINNSTLCPLERNVLKKFYDSTKGQEWTESEYWIDPYTSQCYWQGVVCDKSGTTIIELNLKHNGLSGKLDTGIAELDSLEVLDLNDNDIKGTIPSEIGLLHKLIRLRLSFNAFVGKVPSELGQLDNLELVHLHGNRLSGTVPADMNVKSLPQEETSSFITDCGVPTDFDEPLLCEECTMCCNSAGDCHSTEPAKLAQVQAKGFDSYAQFIWVFLLLLLGYVFLVVIASFYYDRFVYKAPPRSDTERSTIIEDKKYALETIGSDSVYSFYMSKNWHAWGLDLAVLAVQIAALVMFVQAAVKDFSNDRSDFIYSWKCSRNSTICTDESDLNWQGWALFAILMAAHLLKDIINGLKLLILCGKRRHSTTSRMRFFVGGFFLTWISLFTVYASTVYNIAIARSNTDIIINTVIILFICDVDEYFYRAIQAASSFWTAGQRDDEKDDDMESRFEELQRRVEARDEQNEQLEMRVNALERVLMAQQTDVSQDPH